MNRIRIHIFFLIVLLAGGIQAQNPRSVFTDRPVDSAAVYFTPEYFPIKPDGSTDVSDALQEALNTAKHKESGCGILFVPEGVYKLSKTIYIPSGIRLIGYGTKRPVFVLGKNSPGFQEVTHETNKGKYLFWFISGNYRSERPVSDANAGTFYSSLLNADIRIEDGNPNASGIRAHFAQHCSISNVTIHVGKGRAGIVDAGNHLENVSVFGGEYGIDTDKSAPGWPIMLLNSYFEGQRKSAILTNEGGLTIVRMKVKNVPVAVEIKKDAPDRLFMEDCIFENVQQTGLILTDAGNAATQINLRNIQCKNVPVFSLERSTKEQVSGKGKAYCITRFTYGFNANSLEDIPQIVREAETVPIKNIISLDASDTPMLPTMNHWVNIRDLGAKGDGFSDDTEIFREAIKKYTNIYIPQGWYVVKDPLVLEPNTNIIGLHPGTTILLTLGGNPAFSGFGAPQAQLTAPKGGTNIVCGIFLNADAYNYRAVNCKWMAGEGSYLYDVKFSGHDKNRFFYNGQSAANPLEKPMPVTPETHDLITRAWDNQHWSLWITNGGGGTFRDLWTANEYSSAGLYVSHTETPGRIYGMSLEHHLRNEAIFRNVANWKIYDFQFEVEAEGIDTQPLDLIDCRNLTFANFYSYRVSRMLKSYPSAIRTWNCKDIEFLNLHNYAHARVKFTSNASLYDVNSRHEARRWELARLQLTGKENRKYSLNNEIGKAEIIVTGFEFIDGLTKDSQGNIYFCEYRMRRIYKLDIKSGQVTSITDFPWNAVALTCDTQDNLIVVTKYISQPGYKNDDTRNDNQPLFGWRGSGGLWGFTYVPKLYSIRPENADDSFQVLPLVDMSQVQKPQKVCYLANRTITQNEYYGGRKPTQCFVAPDGVTIIPYYEDLFRCSSIVEAVPGETIYTLDEYHQRVIHSETDTQGFLQRSHVFADGGDRSVVTDQTGNVYVANGDISIFDSTGKAIGTIEVPERPTSLLISGDKLYITAISSLYQVRLK
ncbi:MULTISPECIES: glycosyl hydrolase family 28-related protein [Bacteroides]|uniref:glycosyl hydrolase family 28-related protein n=1 Tax=Bacteroides TaxID=816 RepID=UPI000E54B3C7|nr:MULTISPECIES: glycosyl hydrolase family 28-related protein [Bacteroides]RHL12997.1 gluconolaconase [Bacteroides sp. AF39-11AC]